MGFEDLILRTSCIASHVHYNYIFMHFDVCYTCATDCVLVGLEEDDALERREFRDGVDLCFGAMDALT